jgi:hypothetical protein
MFARLPSSEAPLPAPCIQAAYVSIRQHTPAYVSIRQHTSAYACLHACLHRKHPRQLPVFRRY